MIGLGDFKTENFVFINYINLTEEQSIKIWKGRNHPDIRKWMTNSEPFSFDEHCSFIDNLRNRSDRMFWAVIYEGQVVGSYCLNPYSSILKQGELGKYLLPAFLGKGLGKTITKEFLYYVFKHDIVREINVKTLIENKKNQHINELCGFKICGQDEKYIYMKLTKEDFNE